MVFSIFNKLFNIEKIIDAKVENKIADTVKNQIAEQFTVNTDNSKQLVLINQNTTNLVGYDFQQALAIGLQNGNKNSQLLGQELQQKLQSNKISQEVIETRLQDPDFLVSITDASKAGYTESNIEKRKILADLLFNKITNHSDLENLILSQSIKAITSLTEEHLKCLSIILILRSEYIKKSLKDDELNDFFNKFILPLTDLNSNKVGSIGMGLYTAGCATTFSFGSRAYGFFPHDEQNYDEKFQTELIKSKINKFDELIKIWTPSSINCAQLTAIGNCIGQKYLELKTGLVIDLEAVEAK